jgi:Family of unknown function (DUF6941)
MRASIILCDFAEQEVAGGKVHMLGAGWSVIGPAPAPQAVVVLIKMQWTEANRSHNFMLRMTDGDGATVRVPSPAGTQAMEFAGSLEVGRPPGIPPGSEIDTTFVVPLQPLPLTPGQRFTWRLNFGDQEVASETFYVRPLPPQPPGQISQRPEPGA